MDVCLKRMRINEFVMHCLRRKGHLGLCEWQGSEAKARDGYRGPASHPNECSCGDCGPPTFSPLIPPPPPTLAEAVKVIEALLEDGHFETVDVLAQADAFLERVKARHG